MPKIIKPLSLLEVKNAKPREKIYKLSDGGGLHLCVLPSGGKSWRINYINPLNGKSDTITLGLYPDYSLMQARKWRDEVRGKILKGIDPKSRESLGARFIFEKRMIEWYERWRCDGGKMGKGKNEKYAEQVLSALELNVLPDFKGRDVRNISTADVVSVLRKMEERGVLEYLKRVKSSLGLMFDYLVADGTINSNPVRVIGKQVFKASRGGHFDSLKPEQLPLLIERLERTQGVSYRVRLLIYWQLLSITRPNESAHVPLSEIDLNKMIWSIPLQRMKTRPHIVPLSSALVEIYHEAMSINANGIYLFEGLNNQPMHCETARINLRKKMMLPTTGHGLRALATTYLREKFKISKDVRDLLLSHHDESKTDRAYDRSEFLDERREALELWGREVMALRKQYRMD